MNSKHTRPKTFRALVQKHDMLLTVLGALVLVALFWVRDFYLEELRDLSSSIQAGQAEYSRFSDHQEVITTLASLNEAIRKAPPELSPHNDDLRLEEALKRLTAVAKKVPNSHTNLQSIDSLINAIKDYDKSAISALQKGENAWHVWGEQLNLSMRALMLQGSVLQDAEQHKTEVEGSYERWKTISYFIFAFGAILTLIGKLFKMDIDAVP